MVERWAKGKEHVAEPTFKPWSTESKSVTAHQLRIPHPPLASPCSCGSDCGGTSTRLKIIFDTIQSILGTFHGGRLSRSPIGALGCSVAFGQGILSRRLGPMAIRRHRVLRAGSGRCSWRCSRWAGSSSVRRNVGTSALGI